MSDFTPNAELIPATAHSDLYLIFLSANDIMYTSEVNDDWYAAHQYLKLYHSVFSQSSAPIPTYLSDEPASVLGCTRHYEACSPNSAPEEPCLVSGGLYDLSSPNVPQDSDAYSVIPWVTNSLLEFSNIIESLTTSSLTS